MITLNRFRVEPSKRVGARSGQPGRNIEISPLREHDSAVKPADAPPRDFRRARRSYRQRFREFTSLKPVWTALHSRLDFSRGAPGCVVAPQLEKTQAPPRPSRQFRCPIAQSVAPAESSRRTARRPIPRAQARVRRAPCCTARRADIRCASPPRTARAPRRTAHARGRSPPIFWYSTPRFRVASPQTSGIPAPRATAIARLKACSASSIRDLEHRGNAQDCCIRAPDCARRRQPRTARARERRRRAPQPAVQRTAPCQAASARRPTTTDRRSAPPWQCTRSPSAPPFADPQAGHTYATTS